MNSNTIKIHSYGQGEELILIHGFGWDSNIWQSVLPHLCETHRIHVIELPQNFSNLKKLSADIIAKCPNPATWLGWSVGGFIALQAALDHPLQVKKLILVASSPHFMKKADWPGIEPALLAQLDADFQSNKAQTIKKFIRLQTNGNYLLTQELSALKNQSHYDPSVFALLKNIDFTHRLQGLQCPILGIFGQKDRLIPIETSTLLKQYMTVHLFDTAHLPFYEQPKLFAATITEFIQRAA